jgi:signal peptidase I
VGKEKKGGIAMCRAERVALCLCIVAALAVPLLVYLLLWWGVGLRTYVITSESMSPTLEIGEIAIVLPIKEDEVEVGDIITFESTAGKDPRLTHRIVDVVKLSDGRVAYLTKGDANKKIDTWPTESEEVVGRVASVVPTSWLELDKLVVDHGE